MIRPLWAILRSQKCIMRKDYTGKIISCGTYPEFSTRSRCYAVYPYWTNNVWLAKWIELKYICMLYMISHKQSALSLKYICMVVHFMWGTATNPTWFFHLTWSAQPYICTLNSRHFAYVISCTTCICTLTLSTLLVEHIISSIWINRITMRSHWKFAICTTTNDLTCLVFLHYTFLWPKDGPQWPKHVVSLIKQIQRQSCFDIPTPS